MASSFKNASVTISAINTDTTFYTASSVLSAVVHGLYIANKHATANVQVTLKVIDSSESNAERVILHKVPIPPNTTMSLDKPINLEVNDVLKLAATNTNTDGYASVLELT